MKARKRNQQIWSLFIKFMSAWSFGISIMTHWLFYSLYMNLIFSQNDSRTRRKRETLFEQLPKNSNQPKSSSSSSLPLSLSFFGYALSKDSSLYYCYYALFRIYCVYVSAGVWLMQSTFMSRLRDTEMDLLLATCNKNQVSLKFLWTNQPRSQTAHWEIKSNRI